MQLWYWFDRACLHNRRFLTLVLWINILGTIYGYVWYWEQLVETFTTMQPWLVLFVPDSPTASLWFTLSLAFLLYAPRFAQSSAGSFIAALGAISSVKYGVWAVAMNVSIQASGGRLVWEEWMLIGSHLGMAVEALLFIRFFSVKPLHIVAATALLFFNDWLDYNVGIYPWLRNSLVVHLDAIEVFTWILTAVSTVVVLLTYQWSKNGHSPIR